MRKNLALITVDALRADHLGAYGYREGNSPNIDKLANSGAKFNQAISQGGGTPEAFPSILSSSLPPLNPDNYGIRGKNSLAELFREEGYKTAAFIANNPYLSRIFYYNKGFDTFVNTLDLESDSGFWELISKLSNSRYGGLSLIFKGLKSMLGPDDFTSSKDISRMALEWLSSREEPFFLWIHYMDVHHPYVPSSSSLDGVSPSLFDDLRMKLLNYGISKTECSDLSQERIGKIIELYDLCIRSVDRSIGKIIRKLRKDYPNTITVLAADHGEGLGDHGRFSHLGSKLYDEIIKVPLIIHGPSIPKIQIDGQVSLLDLSPTIAGLINLGEYKSFNGGDLAPVIRGENLYSDNIGEKVLSVSFNIPDRERGLSVREEGYKYMVGENMGDDSKVYECFYNLDEDPGEEHNLLSGSIKEAERLRLNKMRKYLRSYKLRENTRVNSKIRDLRKKA